jgi:hypothetical protein
VLIGAALHIVGLTHDNVFWETPLFTYSGAFGDLLRLVLEVNAIVLLFLLCLSVPVGLIIRDARRTLHRFRLVGTDAFDPDVDSIEPYLEGARKVFAEHSEVSVFVFGHTHVAFLHEDAESGRIVLNTGTWLKLLHRVKVPIGYVPAVYCPTYRLNFFRIFEEAGEAVIEYREMPKSTKGELSLLQRMVLMGRRAPKPEPIPARTVIRSKIPALR